MLPLILLSLTIVAGANVVFVLWNLYRRSEIAEQAVASQSTRKQKLIAGSVFSLSSEDKAFLRDLAVSDEIKNLTEKNTLAIFDPQAPVEQSWSDIESAADLQQSPVEFLSQLDLEPTNTAQNINFVELKDKSTLPSKADEVHNDLTALHGLGKASQTVLNKNSIYSLHQIASMTSQQLDALFAQEQKRFQLVDKSTWPLQAQRLIGVGSQEEASTLNLEMEILDEIDSIREIAASAAVSGSTLRKKKLATTSN